MAQRRMFSLQIVDTDAFMDMPLSAQALYFHLGMRADDDGFVSNARRVQKLVGAADDDLKLLIAKRFVLTFESGVIVLKHWKISNYIQKDRYKPTLYQEERRPCTSSQMELTQITLARVRDPVSGPYPKRIQRVKTQQFQRFAPMYPYWIHRIG